MEQMTREQELKAEMFMSKKDHKLKKKQQDKQEKFNEVKPKEWQIKESGKNQDLGNFNWRLRKGW